MSKELRRFSVPIYEYACDTCGHQFEIKQKFSDPPLTDCEKCGNSVRKLISAPGIMFKGTGWYVTDYSNKLKESKDSGEKVGQEKSGDKKEGTSAESSSKSGESSVSRSSPSTSTPPSTSSTSSSSTSTPSSAGTSSS